MMRFALTAAAALLACTAARAAELKTRTDAEIKAEEAAEPNNDKRFEVGYLSCVMTDGSNFIIISDESFLCTFERTADEFTEGYRLEISKFGLDLSATEESELRWAVFAPATLEDEGVLAGEYAGVGADVALGAGIGAKALVGGGDDAIVLQPVSVTTGEGLGAAIGVERATITALSN